MSDFCYFIIFCISQGSVATPFRYDWKYDENLAANLLLRPTVKELLKYVNICQSYTSA